MNRRITKNNKKTLIISLIAAGSVGIIVTGAALGATYGISSSNNQDSSSHYTKYSMDPKSLDKADQQRYADDDYFSNDYLMTLLNVSPAYLETYGTPTLKNKVSDIKEGTIDLEADFITPVWYKGTYTKVAHVEFNGFKKHNQNDGEIIVDWGNSITTTQETVINPVSPLIKQDMTQAQALNSLPTFFDSILQDFRYSFYLDAKAWGDITIHPDDLRPHYYYTINYWSIDLKKNVMYFDIDFGCNHTTYHKFTSIESGTPIQFGQQGARKGILLGNDSYYDKTFSASDISYETKGATFLIDNSNYYKNITFK